MGSVENPGAEQPEAVNRDYHQRRYLETGQDQFSVPNGTTVMRGSGKNTVVTLLPKHLAARTKTSLKR